MNVIVESTGSRPATEGAGENRVPAVPRGDIGEAVEHLFRHEAGKLIATLTRTFGFHNLHLAEDVVQEALVRAMQTWPYYGMPNNPAAWLMRTARNLALDVVRREKVFREKQPQITALTEEQGAGLAGPDQLPCESEIKDDTLRLMFACCHPLIPPESQVALALKTLCGFGTVEIAKAFLTAEATVDKRLTRAKQKLRDGGIRFEIPTGAELAERLDSVSQTLYLLFNEGYKASTGQKLVREELCREAIRLGEFLASHPAGDKPQTHALLALMYLNAARLPARTDATGGVLLLNEQDRSMWDGRMIARGMFHLAQSAAGDRLSKYHLQAGIAACHCAAAEYESTDWARILALYNQLIALDDSAVVALNRAVAVANVHGPAAGLAAVDAMRNREQLKTYYLLYAVRGELEARRSNFAAAASCFRQAVELAGLEAEQGFLTKRIQACEAQTFPTPKPSPVASGARTSVER